ncbi:14170_t:CDS:2, partial [Dentiscutata erythropus]
QFHTPSYTTGYAFRTHHTRNVTTSTKKEATAQLHHKIIKEVYHEIWKPSRTITQQQEFSGGFINIS